MHYNIILIEADPDKTLGGSCLNDLVNFLNYCRLVMTCEKIHMIYVLTNNELTKNQKNRFLLPSKKSSLTFIHFASEKNLIDVVNYFKKHPEPMIVFVSGHGGQLKDQDGDELDGIDEYIYAGKNKIITDDSLTKMLVDQEHTVICIVDSCHSGSMVDLNYKYDGEEFFKNRTNLLPETKTFYIGACQDNQVAWCDVGEKVGFGGALTIKIIEQQLLNNFLKNPTIENITKAYDGLEYFLQFNNQIPSVQTNFLDD